MKNNNFEPDQEALDMAPKMPYHLKKGEMIDDFMVNDFYNNDYLGQI